MGWCGRGLEGMELVIGCYGEECFLEVGIERFGERSVR